MSAVCFLLTFVLWGVCELKGVDVVQIEKNNGIFSTYSVELSPYSYRRKPGYKPDAFHMPLCFLAGIFTALSVVPWLPWWSRRFSLRSLLLTMTMIALLLGMGRVALAVFVGRVVSTLGNQPDVNQKNADDMAVPSLTEIVIVAAVAAVVLLIVWNFKFRKRTVASPTAVEGLCGRTN